MDGPDPIPVLDSDSYVGAFKKRTICNARDLRRKIIFRGRMGLKEFVLVFDQLLGSLLNLGKC